MAALQHSLTCSSKQHRATSRQCCLPLVGRERGQTDLGVPALLCPRSASCAQDSLHTEALLPQALPSAFLQGREFFTQDRHQESDGSNRVFFIILSRQIKAERALCGLQQARFS